MTKGNNNTQNQQNAPAVHPLLLAVFKALGVKPKETAGASAAAPADGGTPATTVPAAQTAASSTPAPRNTAAQTPPAMPNEPLVTVVSRNEYYRDGFRNMIRLVLLQAAIILGLLLTLIVYINSSNPEDRYFATTTDGRIIQMVPLDRANMPTAALLSWVAQSAQEVMTFGYHDYQRSLQRASRNFTKSGWESFTTALQQTRIIDSVVAQQQVVSATPSSAPVVLQEGVRNGRYRWLVRMNLNVHYRGAQASRTDRLVLNLVIERVSSLENPSGIGISQWVATAAGR